MPLAKYKILQNQSAGNQSMHQLRGFFYLTLRFNKRKVSACQSRRYCNIIV